MFYTYATRLQIAEALVVNLRIDAQPGIISANALELLADMPWGLESLHGLAYSLFTIDILTSRIQHGNPNYSLNGRHGAGLTQRVLCWLRKRPGLTASQLVALAERLHQHCQRKRVTCCQSFGGR